MKRRTFIAGLGGAAVTSLVCPTAGSSQQGGRVRRVGVLMNGAPTGPLSPAYLAAFIEGLRQLGWSEGQNLRIDTRWNEGKPEASRTNVTELIALMPDAILAQSTIHLSILQQATSTVPIVFVSVSDPVTQGFVASIQQPGGNLTGFSQYEFSTAGKWLDLLKEVAPALARAGVIFNPDEAPQSKFVMQAIEAPAKSLGVQVIASPVSTTADIEATLARIASVPNSGVILPNGAFATLNARLIVDLAERHRLPSIAAQSGFAKLGGLMDYGVTLNVVDQFRQAASYVDRILKGAKAGDLPVQAPTQYRFVINLKTAKTLGLAVPLPLLGLADEVIE